MTLLGVAGAVGSESNLGGIDAELLSRDARGPFRDLCAPNLWHCLCRLRGCRHGIGFFGFGTFVDFLVDLCHFLRGGRFPDQAVEQKGRTRILSRGHTRLTSLGASCTGPCNDSGWNDHHRDETGKLWTKVGQIKMESRRH